MKPRLVTAEPRDLLQEQTVALLGILAFVAEAAERLSEGSETLDKALLPFQREQMRRMAVANAAFVADIQSNLQGLSVR